MPMHTDLNLLSRYHRQGDAGAFQTLVQMHGGMVFAAARRITQDAALAEEVAQDAFLALARRGHGVKDSVAAWLHHVARQKAVNVVRGEVRRRQREQDAAALHEMEEDSWREIEPLVDEALDALPEEVRTLVIEHYLEQRTQQDMAASLGVSQSTVSRQIERGLQLLREDLRKRGVACGAGLGAVLAAEAGGTAPAALIASLSRLAMSGVGSATTAAAAGSGMIALLSAMKLKLAALLLVVGVLGLAGYDLASKDSMMTQWLKLDRTSAMAAKAKPEREPSTARPAESLAAAASKARLLADAKAIWARTKRLSPDEARLLFTQLYYDKEVDPEKTWATLLSVGFGVSRAAFDRAVARHPGLRAFGDRQLFEAKRSLIKDLYAGWLQESPLEAMAWMTMLRHSEGSSDGLTMSPLIASWVRSNPDRWEAFVAAGPEPRLGEYARLWVENLDDPGSIWARAKAAGFDVQFVENGVRMLIETGAPVDQVFRLIMRCPHFKTRSEQIVGIADRLTEEQLLEAGRSGLFVGLGLGNVLRAMGGDPKVSFKEAADWMTKAADGGGMDAQLAGWSVQSAGRLYAQWVKVDAKAALQHSVRATNKLLLDQFMKVAAHSPALTEAMMVEAFSSPVNRERALGAYYLARANGDPQVAMRSIMNSAYVEDQVECAKQVLRDWAGRAAPEAAAWVATLPANEERAELAATVALLWGESKPEDALAFAQAQGVGLGHGLASGLAWVSRDVPEAKLGKLIAPVRDEPEFNRMLVSLAGWRCPSDPKDAFKLLAKHAKEGWQTLMVEDTARWLGNDDSRQEDYALNLPMIDLTKVDPQSVSKVSKLLTQRLAKKNRLAEALDWTLKLPAGLAPAARTEALLGLVQSQGNQRGAAEQWINRAPLAPEERAALLELMKRRLAVSVETK